MQELGDAVSRLHQEIVAILATPRLDAGTRTKLAEAAQEALRLSQELSKLQGQLALQRQKTGILKQVWKFLTGWVPILYRLKNGHTPDQLGPGD